MAGRWAKSILRETLGGIGQAVPHFLPQLTAVPLFTYSQPLTNPKTLSPNNLTQP